MFGSISTPDPIQQRSLIFVKPTSPCRLNQQTQPTSSSPTRVPWISYYFTDNRRGVAAATTSIPKIECTNDPHGLVKCPVCREHFPNNRLPFHFILHLFLDELRMGSMWPLEFCPECLTIPVKLSSHRAVHDHLRHNDAAILWDNQFVCPACEISFTSIVKFAVHLYEKHIFRDAPYMCTVCFAFQTSCYGDLMDHLHTTHAFTNHLFCPFCLKHFELPEQSDMCCMFTAHQLYSHMRSHWEDQTHRCESCRLDFLHRRDLNIHEYAYHSGQMPVNAAHTLEMNDSMGSDFSHLSLYYSSLLRTATPRIGLKCLECGESLRLPISRHFNLTLRCPSCRYTSSCIVSVHQHWCNVHAAPAIPSSITTGTSSGDISSNLTSWERCVSSLVRTLGLDYKVGRLSAHSRTQDPCGALHSRMRRCKQKHSPAGMEFRGLLRCSCGFRTILGNRMAKHLAIGRCGFESIRLDRTSRLPLFSIVKQSSNRMIRTKERWLNRLRSAPDPLQSVGLCAGGY